MKTEQEILEEMKRLEEIRQAESFSDAEVNARYWALMWALGVEKP